MLFHSSCQSINTRNPRFFSCLLAHYSYTPFVAIRTGRQLVAIVLPRPGVGKFGTAGMSCTLAWPHCLEAYVFRSSYIITFLRCRWFLDFCEIDSKFFCFRIMNRSIRLFCGRLNPADILLNSAGSQISGTW